MADQELSPQERAFIERVQAERAHAHGNKHAPEEVVLEEKRDRSRKLFMAWLAFLAVIPFAISAAFLAQMQNFGELFTSEMTASLTAGDATFADLVRGTPLEGLEVFYEFYINRYYIVAGIFTFFVILIGLSLAINIFITEGKKRFK